MSTDGEFTEVGTTEAEFDAMMAEGEPAVERMPVWKPNRQRALIHLAEEDIAALLGLPDGLRVVGFGVDYHRSGVSVVVEGEILDPVVPGCQLPDLEGVVSRDTVLVGGSRYHRLKWESEQWNCGIWRQHTPHQFWMSGRRLDCAGLPHECTNHSGHSGSRSGGEQ